MKSYLGYLLLLALFGCAKQMDQAPGTADSTLLRDTIALDTAPPQSTSNVPERFRQFFYREFTGNASSSSGRVHTLPVKTIMDVTVAVNSTPPGLVFAITKDGLNITEEPVSVWHGRLVPGTYKIAVTPSPQASSAKAMPYSLTIKEE